MLLRNEKTLSFVLWLIMLAVSAWAHANLPDGPMAVHFGLNGPDGYAPRDTALLIMPAMALAAQVLLLWIVPAFLTQATLERSASAYGAVVVTTLMLLLAIHVVMVMVAKGLDINPAAIVFAGLGLLFIVMGNYLPKTRRNPVMGIRLPWTLADERVWDKTHRFAGPWFLLGGVAMVIAAALLPVREQVVIVLAGALVPAAISAAYSYAVAKKLDLI